MFGRVGGGGVGSVVGVLSSKISYCLSSPGLESLSLEYEGPWD